jgi:hypothetical protein
MEFDCLAGETHRDRIVSPLFAFSRPRRGTGCVTLNGSCPPVASEQQDKPGKTGRCKGKTRNERKSPIRDDTPGEYVLQVKLCSMAPRFQHGRANR